MSDSGEVLLKLLEKVPDAKTLEILLEPANLLILLERYGRDKDELRQALKQGKKPGDLLLELLEQEPDADKLLAQLGTRGSAAFSSSSIPRQDVILADVNVAGIPTSGDDSFPSKKKNDEVADVITDSGNNLFGEQAGSASVLIGIFAVILPAMALTNFLPIVRMTPAVASLIAVLGGAFAGAVSNPMKLFSPKGTFVGVIFGMGALWTTIAYLQLRDTIFHIELVLPLLIGSLPALIVYMILYGKPPKLK